MHTLVHTHSFHSHHIPIPPPTHTHTHTHTYLQGVPSSLDVGVVLQEGRGGDGGEEEGADPREAFQDGSSKGGDGGQGPEA